MHDSVQTQQQSSQDSNPDRAKTNDADMDWWHQPLAREIGLILAIKLVLIFALWWFFFDLPETQRIDSSQVGTHLIGTTSTTVQTPKENLK